LRVLHIQQTGKTSIRFFRKQLRTIRVDLPHLSNVAAEMTFIDEFRQHGLI
jgi:hypothetical protein